MKRILTEEHKRKISESHTGKTLSDETKEKLSLAHKGKPKSESHRKAMSIAAKKRGKPNWEWTPEMKAKANSTRRETLLKKMEEKKESNK